MPIFNIRLTDSEMANLKGKAAAAEVPMTTYVRGRLFNQHAGEAGAPMGAVAEERVGPPGATVRTPASPKPAAQEQARKDARAAQQHRDEVLRKMRGTK